MPKKYLIEGTLEIDDDLVLALKEDIEPFGNNLQLSYLSNGSNTAQVLVRVKIEASEPTIVCDILAEFGRIKTIKIDEL